MKSIETLLGALYGDQNVMVKNLTTCSHFTIAAYPLLECALTLARDLAYIWPRCPHPILSVCNSSIIRCSYSIAISIIRMLNDCRIQP
jgi:hypothetical protein